MKTARETVNDLRLNGHACDCICQRCKNGVEVFILESDIKQIQLDAYRAGLLAAAEVCKSFTKGLDCDSCQSCGAHKNDEKAILTLRDNTTEVPKK